MNTNSNRVPFPHILTVPKEGNQYLLRVVTDEDVLSGERIKEFSHRQRNPETDVMENVFTVYEIKDIEEKRKAKGDWKNWPSHPDYYRAKAKILGNQFESQLGSMDLVK